MMKKWLLLMILALFLLFGASTLFSASIPDSRQIPAPTLVPPTLVPQQSSAREETLSTESVVTRIRNAGVVNVGILYNQPPFGELNIRGELVGYDADLARSMAQTWGVEVNFIQVTRQPERLAELLKTGTVDMLVSALVHERELDAFMEFSQSYYIGEQAIMVRRDDAEKPADMANRRIGVVIATPAEKAVGDWLARSGFSVQINTYLTLDRAYTALAVGEIDGLVDSDYRLRQVSSGQPDLIEILAEPIQLDSFAIAFLRQDASMRDLINRTLQYLTSTGRMNEIHQAYFPGKVNNALIIWKNLGDAPNPSQYEAPIPFPSTYVVPRIQSGNAIRVAGINDAPATESERRLNTFYRELLIQLASRWGVTVEFIPSTPENALELVATGQADIAVGVEPDWAWSNRVDFTLPYLWRGDRLMVEIGSNIRGFSDLRGDKVIVPENQTGAADRAVALANTITATIQTIPQPESELANALFNEELNASAVFGDSIILMAHLQAMPDRLELTRTDDGSAPRWYNPSFINDLRFPPIPIVMATPYNDVDFRLLVNYTLQELIREGIHKTMLQPLIQERDIPVLEIWAGGTNFFGFELSR
ncbi:MAG: transporter substrate-binding domain-containing protein [Anaerolineae bacterium]|nr:transporter substrate-binding domain-containing protein [Anaerolineae bacterium]